MVLDKFVEFRDAIEDHRSKINEIERERVEWCRANRAAIKSLFPKNGKTYKVIDNLLFDGYVLRRIENVSETYYFSPTPNQKFNPVNHFPFHYQSPYPRCKGVLLDCNLVKLFGEIDICITNLEEVAKVKKAKDETNIYVMIDKNTGLYKIGRSVNPSFRERTLQSEKPTIEMIFTARAISNDEKVLHEMFQHQRVRGEWFDLNGTQLNQIKQYITAKSDTQ